MNVSIYITKLSTGGYLPCDIESDCWATGETMEKVVDQFKENYQRYPRHMNAPINHTHYPNNVVYTVIHLSE